MDSSIVAESPVQTVSLGGRSFPIAPLTLGLMKKLKRPLSIVMRTKDLPKTELPDEEVIDAYCAIVAASVCATKAAPELTPAAFIAYVDGLSPFEGMSQLAIASAVVLKLSLGGTDPGEAGGPSVEASPSMPSISTGSTA